MRWVLGEGPFFDLNELPTEEDEEGDGVLRFQPQKALPTSNSHTIDLCATSVGPQRIINNNAFSHASSVSGFQPFVRSRGANSLEEYVEQKRAGNQNLKVASSSRPSNGEEIKAVTPLDLGVVNAQAVEREEGEWSDAEGSVDAYGSSVNERSITDHSKVSQEQVMVEAIDHHASVASTENIPGSIKIHETRKDDNMSHNSQRLDPGLHDQKNNSSRNLEGNAKGDASIDGLGEPVLAPKQREIKGVEASHAPKCANNPGKRQKLDQHKEAMLGKKRSRQTMFLNLEDVKQAGPIKTSTPRRQNFPLPTTTRIVKEIRNVPPLAERAGEKQSQPLTKDQKQVDLSCNDGGPHVETSESKPECNGDMNSGLLVRPRRLNTVTDLSAEVNPSPIPRQSSWKQPTDLRQLKNSQASMRKPALVGQSSLDPKPGNKKLPPSKKQAAINLQYQDTSVERLLREVTNEKFWHHPEETELQCVPGRFESVEEYVRVFEPLLFEECRAQLYSTWEEFTETVSRDIHVMVRVKKNKAGKED